MTKAATTNGFDETTVRRFVSEIERCFDEKLTERMSYMGRCSGITERINQLKDQAKEAGIPKKALNTILKERDLKRKIDALTDEMEEDEVETVDMLRHKLGMLADLPLGAAAVAQAEESGAVAEDQTTTNVRRLRAGLKGLPGADAAHA